MIAHGVAMLGSDISFRRLGLPGFLLWFNLVCVGLAQDATSAQKPADAAYRAGSAAFSKNDYPTARVDFEKVIRLDPAGQQGYRALGLTLLRMGNAGESVPNLERALSLKPSDSDAQLGLAIAYDRLHQPAKEVILLKKLDVAARARKHALPADIEAMYARALAATGQIPAAIPRMKHAVAADPRNAGALDDLGS